MHVKITFQNRSKSVVSSKHEYRIRHMGWLKDRGTTDCANNSIEIYSSTEQKFINFWKTRTKIKLHQTLNWYKNTSKHLKNVGTAIFTTLKWPLCYRLIPDTTTLQSICGPLTFKQNCYFSNFILHQNAIKSIILNKIAQNKTFKNSFLPHIYMPKWCHPVVLETIKR